MVTLPPPSPTPAPIAALQRAQEENRKLKGYIAWEDRLFSNPHLSATHKLALRATRRAVQRGQTHDDQGRTRINLNAIADQIGVSPDTIGRGLKYLESLGVVERQLKPEVQENGERWTRIYARIDEEKIQAPEKILPEQPRNHGGPRYACPRCGNTDLVIRRRVTLLCSCGHESLISETDSRQEQDTDTGPQDAADEQPIEGQLPDEPREGDEPPAASFFGEPARNLQDDLKPVSPPLGGTSSNGTDNGDCSDVKSEQPHHAEPSEPSPQQERQADREAAAALLLALAGPGDEHIEMSRTGSKKYYTVYRPLTQRDLLDHLNGGKAHGAWCSYPGGQTRGLAWDSDTLEGWAALQDAARALADAGYQPLLEESPADRGGHLWIVFDALVDAENARRHARQIAPALADIQEYWPGPEQAKRWNKVRLPGGKYTRPGVNAWCQLISVSDGETSSDGQSAARLLLAHQTPAGLVPASSSGEAPTPDVAQPDEVASVDNEPLPDSNMPAGEDAPHPGVDSQWHARYGQTAEGQRLWFAFTPHDIATWYNAHHAVQDLLPPEQTGYGLATWRGERTASVALRGELWTDFGANARRPDGTQDGGDALELQTRLSQTPKNDILRQAAKVLVAQARAELEGAARAGQPIPAWIEEIITDAGRAHYERVKRDGIAASDTPADEQRAVQIPPQMPAHPEGLSGVSSASDDPAGKMLAGPGEEPCHERASASPAATQPTKDTFEVLAADIGAQIGPPCERCGCTLYYRHAAGDDLCHWCYPRPANSAPGRLSNEQWDRLRRLVRHVRM